MTETRTVSIYALLDPDGTPRYVGSSQNLAARVANHWSARLHPERQSNQRYATWLASLDECGVRFGVKVLEEAPHELRYEAEARWVADLREQGHDLLNINTGAKRAQSVTQAASASAATSWQDPEVRQRRQEGMRERRRLIREGKARCFVCGRGPEPGADGATGSQDVMSTSDEVAS